MFHHQLKAAFNSSLENVSSRISSFVYKSGRDFSRTRKISPSLLMSYLVSQGSSNTCCETLEFLGWPPTFLLPSCGLTCPPAIKYVLSESLCTCFCG